MKNLCAGVRRVGSLDRTTVFYVVSDIIPQELKGCIVACTYACTSSTLLLFRRLFHQNLQVLGKQAAFLTGQGFVLLHMKIQYVKAGNSTR